LERASVPSAGRLDGRTVVLTRAPADNAPLAAALLDRGAVVLELPCVRTDPLDDPSELARALDGLEASDLLVVTSRAGVDAVAALMPGPGIRAPVAAIGRATAARARELGLRVTFVASHADTATLGRDLALPSGEVVLARSDIATPELPRALRERGARIREIAAYRTVIGASGEAAAVAGAIERGRAVIVFASPSAVDGLLGAVPLELARRAEIVAIGGMTAVRVVERLGLPPRIAERPDPPSILREIARVHEEVAS
jgi:uroporphyrinogen-III synthase